MVPALMPASQADGAGRGERACRGREAHDGDDHGCVPGLGDRGRGTGLCAGSACGSRPRRSSASASGWTPAVAQAGGPDLSLRRERDRHRHGQGRAGGPEAGGDPGLHRHPGLPAAPGRGRARRPGADPGRRRGDRALAERRDRGGLAADPGAAAAGRRPGRDHRAGDQLARPGAPTSASRWGRSRRPARWAWPRRPARRR